MIVPGPARRRVDLKGDLAAQALAGDDPRCSRCFCHVRYLFPPSLRATRSNPTACSKAGLLRRGACHRARIRATRWRLAMTAGLSRSLQLAIRRIIRIPLLLAAIKRRAVVGCQRIAFSQAARQIGIGDKNAAERDGVGLAGGDCGFRALARTTAGPNQDPPANGAETHPTTTDRL